jgi:hypothetical protein
VLKKITLYALLFIFGVLSTQSLFLNAANVSENHCGEFNHIHFYKIVHSHSAELKNPIHNSESNTDDDSDCHAYQNLASAYVPQTNIFDFKLTIPTLDFKTVFSEDNHFKSPYLEPFRRPPRKI